MNKILIGIAVLALILGGVGFWINTTKQAPGDRVMDPQPKWTFIDAGETENIPHTNVSVSLYGTTHDLGKYQGSCSEVGASGGIDGKGLLAGEISAAQCYFAGGGDELGVFANEDGGLEVMAGELGEGDAENLPFRGSFKVLLTIN